MGAAIGMDTEELFNDEDLDYTCQTSGFRAHGSKTTAGSSSRNHIVGLIFSILVFFQQTVCLSVHFVSFGSPRLLLQVSALGAVQSWKIGDDNQKCGRKWVALALLLSASVAPQFGTVYLPGKVEWSEGRKVVTCLTMTEAVAVEMRSATNVTCITWSYWTTFCIAEGKLVLRTSVHRVLLNSYRFSCRHSFLSLALCVFCVSSYRPGSRCLICISFRPVCLITCEVLHTFQVGKRQGVWALSLYNNTFL